MRVVDDAQETAFPGGLRQQSENRERHEERIGRRPRTQPERDIERIALWTRQALSERQDRRAELLDCGERELHLALDPGAPDDSQRRGPLDRVVQQSRLADAGLATDDEGAPIAVAGGLHQPIEGGSFAFPTQQLHSPHPPSLSTTHRSSRSACHWGGELRSSGMRTTRMHDDDRGRHVQSHERKRRD